MPSILLFIEALLDKRKKRGCRLDANLKNIQLNNRKLLKPRDHAKLVCHIMRLNSLVLNKHYEITLDVRIWQRFSPYLKEI